MNSLAQSCNFCLCFSDTLIRNQIVRGLRNGGMLKLESALKSLRVTKCRTHRLRQSNVHKVETTRAKKTETQYPKLAGQKHANQKGDDDRVS